MQDCTALLAVQAFDLAADELESRIKELKEKIKRMERDVEEEEKLLRKKEALNQKIVLRRRSAEQDATDLTAKIETADLRLKSVGLTPNAYIALQNEIEKNRTSLTAIEDRILEDMEKLEILEKDIEKSAKVLAGRKQHLEDVKKQISLEIADLQRQIDLQLTQRRQASLKIPSYELELYEEIRHKTKGKAIWDAEKSGCPSCGMSLSAGYINSLAGTNRAEPCPHCGVFLRWVGIIDGLR